MFLFVRCCFSARLPPDQDPAVETRPVPKKVEVGEEVLARWSDDGWYYRGEVFLPRDHPAKSN